MALYIIDRISRIKNHMAHRIKLYKYFNYSVCVPMAYTVELRELKASLHYSYLHSHSYVSGRNTARSPL